MQAHTGLSRMNNKTNNLRLQVSFHKPSELSALPLYSENSVNISNNNQIKITLFGEEHSIENVTSHFFRFPHKEESIIVGQFDASLNGLPFQYIVFWDSKFEEYQGVGFVEINGAKDTLYFSTGSNRVPPPGAQKVGTINPNSNNVVSDSDVGILSTDEHLIWTGINVMAKMRWSGGKLEPYNGKTWYLTKGNDTLTSIVSSPAYVPKSSNYIIGWATHFEYRLSSPSSNVAVTPYKPSISQNNSSWSVNVGYSFYGFGAGVAYNGASNSGDITIGNPGIWRFSTANQEATYLENIGSKGIPVQGHIFVNPYAAIDSTSLSASVKIKWVEYVSDYPGGSYYYPKFYEGIIGYTTSVLVRP